MIKTQKTGYTNLNKTNNADRRLKQSAKKELQLLVAEHTRKKTYNNKKKLWRQRKADISKENGMLSVNEVVHETTHFIKAFIGEMAQAPLHLIDNEYIKSGYRIGYTRSFRSILYSLFQFHNESVNVWSHLLGMLFFASMIFYSIYTISNMRDAGSFVASGLEQARA